MLKLLHAFNYLGRNRERREAEETFSDIPSLSRSSLGRKKRLPKLIRQMEMKKATICPLFPFVLVLVS